MISKAGGPNPHYRPNLKPVEPQSAYKGNHKVEKLTQVKEGQVKVTLPDLDMKQQASLKDRHVQVMDSAKHVEVTNLANKYLNI